MERTKILLVEDDENLGGLLRQYLHAKNFEADLYVNGKEGFDAFINKRYDLCVLDIMMPVKDGFSLAREIRAINSDIPIIFLTAKSMKEDVHQGFKIGADDYITKPFSMEEFLLRIEAILRRTKNMKGSNTSHFKLGKYTFDSENRTLSDNGNEKKLTTKESELLKLFCTYQNEVLERDFALRAIWSDDSYFNARSMDVYITKLRKYLSDEPSVEIVNVHGKGFKLRID